VGTFQSRKPSAMTSVRTQASQVTVSTLAPAVAVSPGTALYPDSVHISGSPDATAAASMRVVAKAVDATVFMAISVVALARRPVRVP